MTDTKTTQSLVAKLQKVQATLKVPKSQRNEFAKYNYRSCEDILEAVKPLLDKHALVLLLSDHVELVGDRYYVVAKASLLNADSSESMYVEARAREEETKKGMDGSQITGAASSYARKYALNGLFDIDDTKDADGEDNRGHVAAKPKAPANTSTPPGATPLQKSRITSFMRAKGVADEDISGVLAEDFKVADPHHMTSAEAGRVLREMESHDRTA